jgi:hypothetical protein
MKQDRCEVGGWTAAVSAQGPLEVSGDGGPDDWWRAVATAAWTWSDAHGSTPDASNLTPSV